MMDCAHYRRSMLADPHDQDAKVREHRASCRDCSLFSDRLLRFESRLDRALRVSLPATAAATGSEKVVPLRAKSSLRFPSPGKGWLAMAASGLLAVVVAGGLWLSVPRPSLAADVVTHMAGEPAAWRVTDVPVTGDALQDVLRNAPLRL